MTDDPLYLFENPREKPEQKKQSRPKRRPRTTAKQLRHDALQEARVRATHEGKSGPAIAREIGTEAASLPPKPLSHLEAEAARLAPLAARLGNSAVAMAQIGCSNTDICRVAGIRESELVAVLEAYPALFEQLEKARANGNTQVVTALFKKATAGDIAAIRIWLFNRCPDFWKDPTRVRIEAPQESGDRTLPDVTDEALVLMARQIVEKAEAGEFDSTPDPETLQ